MALGMCRGLIIVILGALMITKQALAAQHLVGWDQSTDFDSWSSSQTFKLGDQLVFQYTSLHSVVELPNESAYKNCDISNALDSKSSGNDVIKLGKSGTRYFACGTPGHCSQGMKLKVTVGDGNSASSPPSSSSSSSTSSGAFSDLTASGLLLVLCLSFLATFWSSLY